VRGLGLDNPGDAIIGELGPAPVGVTLVGVTLVGLSAFGCVSSVECGMSDDRPRAVNVSLGCIKFKGAGRWLELPGGLFALSLLSTPLFVILSALVEPVEGAFLVVVWRTAEHHGCFRALV
jgi:hypothetical protein